MARRKKKMHFSGIGGQAVLEGVMMKNKDDYAVAVRKQNGEIDVDIEVFHPFLKNSVVRKIPFVRGIFNFIDSLVLGMKSINHSAKFYEDEEDTKPTGLDKALDKISGGKSESILSAITTLISLAIAIALFMVLPYFISQKLMTYVRNESLLAIIEGVVRIVIFLLYVSGISLMKDVRRLYRYHGAEHKCINCIERGRALTVSNVMHSSRFHKRCGTSFIFIVLLISVVLFFFIRVDNPAERLLIRLALVPVIAGVSYEIIRLAGKFDNFFISIISAPGLWTQRITTKEPDEEMVEVAIRSVEAVFDWKQFLMDEFDFRPEDFDSEE